MSSTAESTAGIAFNLHTGDVFVGRYAHNQGHVIRVEGKAGSKFTVRHQQTGNTRNVTPVHLFGSYMPVTAEEGRRLWPDQIDVRPVSVAVDHDSAEVAETRRGGKRTRSSARAKLAPSTGSVSVAPSPAPAAVTHEPPPPPAANDTTAAPLATTSAPAGSDVIAVVMTLMREQREENRAFMERILDRLSPQSTPTVKTREEEREEATNRQVNEEMPWAKPQLDRFIDETMEFVTFSSPSEIERALRPGEVFDQFSLWCEVNGLRVPFPKTVFRALLDDKRTKQRWKINSKEDKTPLAIRRQTRFGFDESGPVGKDVQVVMAHARRTAWPALAESYREPIARLLMDGVSKADLLTALDHIAGMGARGSSAYTPDSVLSAKHVRALVRLARAEGPAK